MNESPRTRIEEPQREPQIVRCVQCINDEYAPWADWTKYTREEIKRAIVDELEKNGFIEWDEWRDENNPKMHYIGARLVILAKKPPEASPDASKFDSNVVGG